MRSSVLFSTSNGYEFRFSFIHPARHLGELLLDLLNICIELSGYTCLSSVGYEEIGFGSKIVSGFVNFLSNIIAYSRMARNTCPTHTKRNISSACKKPLDGGAFFLAPINIFISTKNTVTSKPSRPGTTVGFMMKDTQDTTTNKDDVR